MPDLSFTGPGEVHAPYLDVDQIEKALKEHGSCIDTLSHFLPGKVFTKNKPSYNEYLDTFWLGPAREIFPRCVVIPSNTSDVSKAISVLSSALKLGIDCKFAIRSGNAAAFANLSNIDDGIVIWLKDLKELDLAEDRSVIRVGPGNSAGDVYGKLDPMDLTAVLGLHSMLGVSGLVLGGGWSSILSPQYGLACDNVLNFEVVLSSGAVVNVNATSNPDLFRALKGGASNFGIVTRFDLAVIKLGSFSGGQIFADLSKRQEIFRFAENYMKADDYTPQASMIMNLGYMAGMGWGMFYFPTYIGPEENPSILAPVLKMNDVKSTFRVSHTREFTDQLDQMIPPGLRSTVSTFTFSLNAEFMEVYFQMAKEMVDELKDIFPGFAAAVAFHPFPKQAFSQSKKSGGNSLGLSEEDGDICKTFAYMMWDSAKDDEKVKAAMKDLIERGKTEAVRRGLLKDYVPISYAAPWQDVFGGYGKENLEAMRQASKKYDPLQLFQLAVPGGWKLSK
ncbi:FAD-binding domain-containing protein [Rhizodiscina lignyota]|uniref:FAD-binding domain-containing protein n=1 Tax=Rhizodiscina lignyota TaxID=1504668 RepID=A0A9P4M900_9PEZI|nr:FAD-binding domain-containing protein [Rhizodiscina lignyota]